MFRRSFNAILAERALVSGLKFLGGLAGDEGFSQSVPVGREHKHRHWQADNTSDSGLFAPYHTALTYSWSSTPTFCRRVARGQIQQALLHPTHHAAGPPLQLQPPPNDESNHVGMPGPPLAAQETQLVVQGDRAGDGMVAAVLSVRRGRGSGEAAMDSDSDGDQATRRARPQRLASWTMARTALRDRQEQKRRGSAPAADRQLRSRSSGPKPPDLDQPAEGSRALL
jgi:hypothetical protein